LSLLLPDANICFEILKTRFLIPVFSLNRKRREGIDQAQDEKDDCCFLSLGWFAAAWN